ncbi:MAG: FAD-dependent oxidoreductase [Polyangiaceae bacterium]
MISSRTSALRAVSLFATLVGLSATCGCSTTTVDLASDGGTTDGGTTSATECEVVVVGGGAGGLHTAFRLAPTLGSKVCLFEREKELGGRIKDIRLDETDPNAPRVGVGARRVMESENVLFALATELGLELETPPSLADLIEARGTFSFSKDDLAEKKYPTVPASTVADKDRETVLYDTLRASPERAKLPSAEYPNFQTYVKKVVGAEGYAFLRDMSRFRADFEMELDARGYLDYFDEEWDNCCTPSYPKGGMSAFIRGMETAATKAGARIFKEEGVTSIAKNAAGGYDLVTAKQKVHATKLVLGLPPSGLDKVTGDVADRIKEQSNYKSIVGAKVATITQFWPEAWWKAVKNPAATKDPNVWRAWTTTHCMNFIEIPYEPNVDAGPEDPRAASSTGRNASTSGRSSPRKDGQGRGRTPELTAVFNNGVSTPATVTIPKPNKTVVQIWPDAWHWLKAGATITNAQLSDWALEPLAGEPVALVGEAYWVNRSGWSDGAYKSSLRLLNTKYGMTLPGLATKSMRPLMSRPRPRTSGPTQR